MSVYIVVSTLKNAIYKFYQNVKNLRIYKPDLFNKVYLHLGWRL